jgi:TolB protein
MSRVIGVYGLGMVGVLAVLVICTITFGNILHAPILTFITYDPNGVLIGFDTSTGHTMRMHDDTSVFDYAWSPNGRMLALLGIRQGLSDAYIFIFDLAGNEIQRIVDPNVHTFFASPMWLPDNETLLFQLYGESGAQIYAVNIHTPDDWQLLINTRKDIDFYDDLSVSPDGSQLLFTRLEGSVIYTLNVDGTQLQQIEDNGAFPVWSIDGGAIAFTRYQPQPVLYFLYLDFGTSQRFFQDGIFGAQWAWLRDRSQIAYTLTYGGTDDEIFIMNADGANMHQITINDRDDSQPAWMP